MQTVTVTLASNLMRLGPPRLNIDVAWQDEIHQEKSELDHYLI